MAELQQVNLLCEDFLPRTEPLNEKHFGAICAGFVLLLLAVSLFDGLAIADLEEDIQVHRHKLDEVNSSIEQLRQSQAGGESVLREELIRLRARRAEQSMLVQILSKDGGTGAPAQQQGIASAMVVLAENKLPGLWLSEIKIYPERLQLKGHALEPVMVPRYLQELAADGRFAGHRFEMVEVRQPAAQRWVDFELLSPEQSSTRGTGG